MSGRWQHREGFLPLSPPETSQHIPTATRALVATQHGPLEIIVVDGQSKDDYARQGSTMPVLWLHRVGMLRQQLRNAALWLRVPTGTPPPAWPAGSTELHSTFHP